jgi:hypothetical protein
MERLIGHSELQELLGAYALDAVEREEADAIERHLRTCPRCRNELADHREVAALIGYAGGAAPVGLWDRIIATLEEPPPALLFTRASGLAAVAPTPLTESTTAEPPSAAGATTSAGPPLDLDAIAGGWGPQTPPSIHSRDADQSERVPAEVVPITRSRRRSGPRRSVPMRFMVAMATAAAVIVAVLGVEVGRLEVHKPAQVTSLSALAYQAADADPEARHLTLTSADGVHTVRAVMIADGTTYLGPGNLAVLPSNETYQMWGVVNGARVSLGVIGDNPTYAAFTTPAVANVLAMTVETRGGVVTSTKAPVVSTFLPSA